MTTDTASRPSHVPEALFLDDDFIRYSMEGDDPFKAISRLHGGEGVVWITNAHFGQPGWLVTSNEYVREVFSDWEKFSSDYRALELLGMTLKLTPLEFDPPQHHLYRRILNPFFTPLKVREREDAIRAACDDLIAKFEDRGSCEFISEFGEILPAHIFLDLMGLPKDRLDEFLAWEHDLIRAEDPGKRIAAMQSTIGYLGEFIQQQKKNPTTELLEAMVTARYDDSRGLTDEEILGMCYLLYIAGLDTIYSVLGWTLKHIASDPGLQARLRNDPESIPGAVEEFIRAFGVPSPTRRVREDCEFHGIAMKAGELVIPCIPAAARDPRVYADPDKIDIDRSARHLSFATGPHICLGMHLARREIAIVIETFLSRFDNIRIPEGETVSYHAGGVFGVDRLPLEWENRRG